MSVVRLSDESSAPAAAGPNPGAQAGMQEVYRLIEQVGPTEACVMLTAEGAPETPRDWPGNVCELRNSIVRAFILGNQTAEFAPPRKSPAAAAQTSDPPDERERLDIRVGSRIHDMERSLIEATLDYFQGNKRRAADALGCSLKTLYNKLNGYSQRQCANG